MHRITAILLTFLIFSWGVSTGNKHHAVKSIRITDLTDKIDRRHYLGGITDANMLISTLNTSSTLEDANIGYTGENSLSYGYYLRLKEIASDSVLVALTYHKNPKIRVYGMWALAENNNKLAMLQMKRLQHDQATVMYQSGCTTMPESVCALAARNFDTSEVKVYYTGKNGFLYAEVALK